MPLKSKKERRRREKLRTKVAPGTKVRLDTSMSDRDVSHMANAMMNGQSLSEIQHESPIIWVVRNIMTEKAEPMSFKDRPYLVDIYKDFSPHIIVKKGAQIGLTQLSISKLLYVSDTRNMTSIYTFPTASDVSDFSKSRFKTIISNSKYLTSRLHNYDSQGYREIGHSKIYFRGTKSERQAISIPSDLNVHDELDFSDPDVRDVFSSRLSVSKYKWEWDFSTPTIPDFGIDVLWKESDKHVWVMKCERCNLRQTIDYFKNLRRRKKVGGEKRWYFGCRRCDKRLDRRKGEWVSLNPKADIRGYNVPQSICPVISAGYMVSEYKKAERTGRMKKFFNFNLGKTYESGSNTLTRKIIRSKIVPSTMEKGTAICIGADQGDTLNVVVSKITEQRRYTWIGKLSSIPELKDMIDHYTRTNLTVCVLDAMPNHNEAVRYAESMNNLILCYYNDKGGLDKESLESDVDDKEIHVARTDLLDHTAHLWKTGEVLIEQNNIPPEDINEFIEQMLNMKRDMEEDKRSGGERAVWKRTGADHYRHADAYNWLAMQLVTNQMSDELVTDEHVWDDYAAENLFSEAQVW